MSEVILKSEFCAQTALAAAASGQKIAVICRGLWDAKDAGDAVMRRSAACQTANFRYFAARLEHPSGGVIEFVWLETPSRRRVDDFDHVTFHAKPGTKPDAA